MKWLYRLATQSVKGLRIVGPSCLEKQDLVQEAAIGIYRAFERGVTEPPLLATIGRRDAIDALREAHGRTDRNVAKRSLARLEDAHYLAVEPRVQSNYWRAAEKLPPINRDAVLLTCILGRETEAAAVVGCKVNAMYQRYRNGVGKLRRAAGVA